MAKATISKEELLSLYNAINFLRQYIDDNRERINSYDIATDSLDWNIDNVEMCIDRIALKESRGE